MLTKKECVVINSHESNFTTESKYALSSTITLQSDSTIMLQSY